MYKCIVFIVLSIRLFADGFLADNKGSLWIIRKYKLQRDFFMNDYYISSPIKSDDIHFKVSLDSNDVDMPRHGNRFFLELYTDEVYSIDNIESIKIYSITKKGRELIFDVLSGWHIDNSNIYIKANSYKREITLMDVNPVYSKDFTSDINLNDYTNSSRSVINKNSKLEMDIIYQGNLTKEVKSYRLGKELVEAISILIESHNKAMLYYVSQNISNYN